MQPMLYYLYNFDRFIFWKSENNLVVNLSQRVMTVLPKCKLYKKVQISFQWYSVLTVPQLSICSSFFKCWQIVKEQRFQGYMLVN